MNTDKERCHVLSFLKFKISIMHHSGLPSLLAHYRVITGIPGTQQLCLSALGVCGTHAVICILFGGGEVSREPLFVFFSGRLQPTKNVDSRTAVATANSATLPVLSRVGCIVDLLAIGFC